MGTVTNTEVIDFTAGMNTLLAPHMIAKAEARVLVNVDIRRGALQSMPNLNKIKEISNSHFVEFLDVIYSYDGWRANALLDNNLYWANGVTSGKILYDGSELPLGVASPTNSPTIAATDTGAGEHKGDFKYTYTFYSTTTGIESGPAPLPIYLTVDKDNITVSGLQALPTEFDKYRIYRIGGYLPRFTMVAEISDTDTPYKDELSDDEIDGRLLQTLRTEAPPGGLNDLVELNGRLFGSVGAKVYFSAVGQPDSWYSSDFFTLPSRITGIAKSQAGLLVFGVKFTYMLVGTSPANFRLKVISNKLGCVYRESISYLRGVAVWLGQTGIYTSDGYNIVELTSNKIDRIGDIRPTSSCVVNSVYYLAFKPALTPKDSLFPSNELVPAGALGTSEIEEGIIALDFKRGKSYSYKLIEYDLLSSIGIYEGEVHVVTSINDMIFVYCDAPLGCDDFLSCSPHELNIMNRYVGQELTELHYVSPQFVDGSLSTLKEYEKIRINFRGSFRIRVFYSNGSKVIDTEITSLKDGEVVEIADTQSVVFNVDAVTLIGFPNGNNKSNAISFIIDGIGVINSIQYSWKPRELP